MVDGWGFRCQGADDSSHTMCRWLYCEACGKGRLTHRQLRPWEDFVCGGEQALLPKRGCESAEDNVLEWYVR